jgi:predicted TIM-barrel fold metal-dependent hydrolase
MSGDLSIIDAHQHFWDPQRNHYPWLSDARMIPFRYGDYSALKRRYLPEDYRADSASHRVVATVHVEAEWDPRDPVGETRWLAAVREATGLPTVAVAQAWLDREDAAAVLAAQAAFPFVRGIRHKPRAAASPREVAPGAPGSMDDENWRRGYALLERHSLSFDLQTPWWHLPEAARLARDFPRTQIIVNHTGLPADRSAEGLAAWRAALEQAAALPNIALKISGLGLRGQRWSVEANAPVVREAIRIFDVERCLFASNYPVDSLVGSFDAIFSGFKAMTSDLPPADRRKLFHDNAARIYRIDLSLAINFVAEARLSACRQSQT